MFRFFVVQVLIPAAKRSWATYFGKSNSSEEDKKSTKESHIELEFVKVPQEDVDSNKVVDSNKGELTTVEIKKKIKEMQDEEINYFIFFAIQILYMWGCMITYLILGEYSSASTAWGRYTNFYGYTYNSLILPVTNVFATCVAKGTLFEQYRTDIESNLIFETPPNSLVRYNKTQDEKVRSGSTASTAIADKIDSVDDLLSCILVRTYLKAVETTTSGSNTETTTIQFADIILDGVEMKEVQCRFLYPHDKTICEYLYLHPSRRKGSPMIDKTDIFLFAMCPIMPGFCTHIFPGLILYGWTSIFLIIAVSIGVGVSEVAVDILGIIAEALFKVKIIEPKTKSKIIFSYFHVFISQLIMIYMCQTIFNYAALFYDHHGYINTIVMEYQLRTQTECFLSHSLDHFVTGVAIFDWL